MQTKNTKQGGFTLVEIAIVLVIIGLLLGGILKGQELINNAKVRSVADRQNSLKAAWFGFVDRYNFIPGDSKRAVQLVPEASPRNDTSGAGDGRLTIGESTAAMQQLTGAGFLRCPQCNGGLPETNRESAGNSPNAENSLVNQYSGVMSIWNDSGYFAFRGVGNAPAVGRLQIHSGPRIPSNILSEVDRKIDDGVGNTGDMVFNGFDPLRHQTAPTAIDDDITYGTSNVGTDNEPSVGRCMNTLNTDLEFNQPATGLIQDAEVVWRTADATGGAVENNCGASVFI